MRFEDLVIMSCKTVVRERRRYKLVFLAICFGAAGLVIIFSTADRVEKKMGEHLIVLGGSTILTLKQNNSQDDHHPIEFGNEDIMLLKKIPHVMEVAPLISKDFIPAASNQNRWNVQLTACDDAFFRTIMAYIRIGRLISHADVKNRNTVCLLGRDARRKLFGVMDPTGKSIQLGHTSFRVIGVLGGVQGEDTHRSIFIPITAARDRFEGFDAVKTLRIRADHWNTVLQVKNEISNLIKRSPKRSWTGLEVEHYPERIKRVQNSARLVKALVYMGLLTIVVFGGVGIMHIMLASVQERTREIGLKKAIGAQDKDIFLQFLLESSTVSFCASVTGIVIGLLFLKILDVRFELGVSPVLVCISVLGGFFLTTSIGLWSGIYPAVKASKLDVVTALSFE